jgi:hypothetical protein
MTTWKPRHREILRFIERTDPPTGGGESFLSPYDIPTRVDVEVRREIGSGDRLRVRFRYVQPDEPTTPIKLNEHVVAEIGRSGRVYEIRLPVDWNGDLRGLVRSVLINRVIDAGSDDDVDFAETYSNLISGFVRESAQCRDSAEPA